VKNVRQHRAGMDAKGRQIQSLAVFRSFNQPSLRLSACYSSTMCLLSGRHRVGLCEVLLEAEPLRFLS
jgi:hypothetical protein